MAQRRAGQGPTWRDCCLSTGPLGQPLVGAHEQTQKARERQKKSQSRKMGESEEKRNREKTEERQREDGREAERGRQ